MCESVRCSVQQHPTASVSAAALSGSSGYPCLFTSPSPTSLTLLPPVHPGQVLCIHLEIKKQPIKKPSFSLPALPSRPHRNELNPPGKHRQAAALFRLSLSAAHCFMVIHQGDEEQRSNFFLKKKKFPRQNTIFSPSPLFSFSAI